MGKKLAEVTRSRSQSLNSQQNNHVQFQLLPRDEGYKSIIYLISQVTN